MADGLLPAALTLAARGWRVHPIHPILPGGACGCGGDCEAAGKHPRLTAWQRAASADPEQVRKWWSARPGDGIGVATGPGSGVVVVDLDPRHGGDASFAAVLRERGERLETLRVRTGGGGWHLYFVAPPRRIGNRAGVLPGVDVRGAGGYVVGPGSPHASGTDYAIDRDVEPLPMPEWLVELCAAPAARRAVQSVPTPYAPTADDRERRYALAVLDNAARTIAATAEGSRRNDLLREAFKLGGYVGSGALAESLARAALVAAAASCGLPDREAAKTIDDGLRDGAASPLRAPERHGDAWRAPAPQPSNGGGAPVVAPAGEEAGPPEAPHPADDPAADEERIFDRGDQVELGIDLLDRLGGPDAVVHDEGETRATDGTTWALLDDLDLERRAHGYAGRLRWGPPKDGAPTTCAIRLTATAAAGIVRVLRAQASAPGFFAAAPEGAAFLDQFYRLDGAEILVEPLRAEHRVRRDLVAPYAPTPGPTPAFGRLLAQAWEGCPDLDARITYLLEWIGAALLGIATRWKDSPLLVGPKDTGKSQIVAAVLALFPRASHRHATLHAMGTEFGAARLVGGRVNAVSELPSRELLESETAKAILSGDPVDACRKYEQPFTLRSRCAHIYAANEIPPSLDAALRERFVLLSCPHVVPEHQQDHGLTARLEREAPQLAAHALGAVPALIERGRFVRPESARAAGDAWAMSSDPVLAWSAECLRRSDTARLSGGTAYREFCRWSEENGHRRMASNRFGERLQALGYERLRSNGSWWGAELLGGAEAESQQRWGMRGPS